MTEADIKLLITLPSILGHFAQWAVRQSPYPAPDKLTEAVAGFDSHFVDDPDETVGSLRMVSLTYDELSDAIWQAIEATPEAVAWNTPKSGHNANVVFSSRYDIPEQDDDFIDLHALCGNVTRSVWAEAERDAEDDEAWLSDSDGNPEGGDGTAPSQSDDSADPKGIAQ